MVFGVSFRNALGFLEWTEQTNIYPLKFPNVQINLVFENTPWNKSLSKVHDEKDNRTVPVNAIRVPFWLAWNKFLYSVTESVFSKASPDFN